jgi:signal transduction histidine kinase
MPAGGTLTLATTFVAVPFDANALYAAPPGQYIVLTIADTGVGMAPGATRQMFEPYYSTKSELHSGAGLGLASVRGIANEHGWVISVDSESEVGTAVSIYMPLAPDVDDALPADDDQSTLETVPARSA